MRKLLIEGVVIFTSIIVTSIIVSVSLYKNNMNNNIEELIDTNTINKDDNNEKKYNVIYKI